MYVCIKVFLQSTAYAVVNQWQIFTKEFPISPHNEPLGTIMRAVVRGVNALVDNKLNNFEYVIT